MCFMYQSIFDLTGKSVNFSTLPTSKIWLLVFFGEDYQQMCFMYQSIFDLFMRNGEGAFNLFFSVAVGSLQFFSSFA